MSTLKVDTINTTDGTGNITVSRPLSGSGASLTNLPAANLTGALPAISGAALTNLPAGGDKRNYIIDGSFNHWVIGNVTSFVATAPGNYGHTLWRAERGGATAEANAHKNTTVPTVAQSGYNSGSSMWIDVTTADSGGDAGDKLSLLYNVTGTDYQALHGQQVTFAFWIRSSITGTFYVAFQNSAKDRSLVSPYTISSADTWEYKTITVTLDTSGTWLFTEAGVGLRIIFQMMAGSTHHASAANTWQAGEKTGLSGNGNMFSSNANNIFFAQVGLYLGSTAPTFLGEPITTVRNQVDYYVQRFQYDGAANETIASGYCTDTARSQSIIYFRKEMRALPTGSSSTAGFRFCANACADVATSVSVGAIGRHAAYFQASQSGTSFTAGQGGRLLRDTSDECFLMFDARH